MTPRKTNPGKKNTWHPKRLLSGERAKAFRRQLSATASDKKNSTYVFTLKFPLAAKEPSEEARNALRLQYEKLASIRENSLFHFFAAVHLAGFRLFSSKNAATAHLEKSTLAQSAINQQFNNAFGLEGAGIDLLLGLEAEFRRDNKNADGVLRRIESEVPAIKQALKNNRQLAVFVKALCKRIDAEESWSHQQKTERWNAVVKTGKEMKFKFTLPKTNSYNNHVWTWDNTTQSFLKGARYDKDNLQYAMHQMVSLAAFVARKDDPQTAINPTTIKKVLLSDNASYNALSALFNPANGLKFFAKDIQSDSHFAECPDKALKDIQHIAGTLLQHDISYHNFRSLFGGNIASGISNYWKRLIELQKSLENIDTESPNLEKAIHELEEKEIIKGVAHEFSRVTAGVGALNKLLENLAGEKSKAEQALNALMGKGKTVAGENEVRRMEEFQDMFEECRGLVLQLAEIIRKKANHKKSDYSEARKILPAYFFPKENTSDDETEDTTKFLSRKLNRYRGAAVYSPDEINQELQGDGARLQLLRDRRATHWQKIAEKNEIDIIAGRENTEQQRLAERTQREGVNITELACRFTLSRIAGTVRRCGHDSIRAAGVRLFKDGGVFARQNEGTAFFANNKGRIYKSPFANYQHNGLDLGEAFTQTTMRAATESFVRKFKKWVAQLDGSSMNSTRDVAILEQCIFDLQVTGLQKDVPSHLATPDEHCELSLPHSVNLALKKDTVGTGEVARIFNGYASKINGLCARLSRDEVIVKLRLQHIGDKAFYWLPKTSKNWRLPPAIATGESNLAKGWKYLQKSKDLFVNGDVNSGIAAARLADTVRSLDKMGSTKGHNGEAILCACLREMPHDWYYKVGKHYPQLEPTVDEKHKPFVNDKNLLDGLMEVNGGKITLKNMASDCQPQHYIRLVGPSRYKGWLDKALLPDKKQRVTFGDTSLIVEKEYMQSFNGGELRAEYKKTRLLAAAVFKAPTPVIAQNTVFPFARRFIAIDLGERGIGYAVFNVPDAKTTVQIDPAEFGHVAVPILRHLMQRVDNDRRRKQPRQRFQSNINTSLQQMREAAIGELAGVIDGLMEKYEAFPIFESNVGSFESGGRMLKMVYGSILHLYLYRTVDAHESKRAQHWLTGGRAPRWIHPDIIRTGKTNNTALVLYPGASVNAYGTSQTCSRCGKNPVEIMNDIQVGKLTSNAKGMLWLGEGKDDAIYIYGGRSAKKKSDNPLPSFEELKRDYSFANQNELKSHVKGMLRHKPPSAQSKDTGQSSYLSPFVAVQEELRNWDDIKLKENKMFRRNGLVFMHADINAAINIGKKWWREKVCHDS